MHKLVIAKKNLVWYRLVTGDFNDRDTACLRSHMYRYNCGREKSTYSRRDFLESLYRVTLEFSVAKWNEDKLKVVPATCNGNDALCGLL